MLDLDDPRLQPGAYISHGGNLYEAIGPHDDANYLKVRNCKSGVANSFGVLFVITHWTLEKRAPTVPDYIPETFEEEAAV